MPSWTSLCPTRCHKGCWSGLWESIAQGQASSFWSTLTKCLVRGKVSWKVHFFGHLWIIKMMNISPTIFGLSPKSSDIQHFHANPASLHTFDFVVPFKKTNRWISVCSVWVGVFLRFSLSSQVLELSLFVMPFTTSCFWSKQQNQPHPITRMVL